MSHISIFCNLLLRQKTAAPVLQGASIKSIIKTGPFFLTMAVILLVNLTMTGFSNNAATFYQSLGVDAIQASYGISAYSVGQLVWSYVFGWIVDKKGVGISTLIMGGIGAVTLVAGMFLTGFSGVIIIGFCVAAICFGGTLASLVFPRLYGMKEVGTLIGWSNAVGSVGTMFGAPIAALIFGATGSFKIYLLIGAVIIAISILLVLAVTSKKTIASMNAIRD